jgi:DNA polymerase (family 10)
MSIQIKNIILAEKFKLLGDLTVLDGDKGAMWKSKTYYKAADILSGLDIPATSVGDFESFNGIGKSTAKKIVDFIKSGTTVQLELLRAKHPGAEDALALTSVSGIGVKKALKLYNDFGIQNFDDLSKACDAGKISNGQIVRGVALAKKSAGRLPITTVMPVVRPILDSLRAMPEVTRAEFAGSARRGRETVRDIDILVVATDREVVKKYFLTLGEELIAGKKKARIFAPIDSRISVQVDLLFCEDDAWGSSIAYFTGSKEHNIALRTLANQKGYTFNEHGYYKATGERVGGATELELYELLGLPWCPPELREGDTLLAIVPDLVKSGDFWGDWHMHSTYSSDAKSTVMEMAVAAKAKGLKVIGFTDHVEKQYQWRPEDIPKRREEIEAAISATGIQIYAGAEVGVNLDGTLVDRIDLDAQDYLIASIHRSHAKEPVDRLIKAMTAHPKVMIIGHPTGRMLGRRDIPDDDWDRLFQACAINNVALEINGPRLDLPVNLIRRAKALGCKFVVNSDAHHTSQLTWQNYGITLARRAGLTLDDLQIPDCD